MRIIGGSLKGKSIFLPSALKARPTTDFAKEGLFNVLENSLDFKSARVLDLFSGTGSISFEFASRGCPEVFSVEMNPLHASFITKNAVSLGIKEKIRVVRHNVFEFIEICHLDYDVIFVDPPYSIEGLDAIPDKIFGHSIDEGGTPFLKRGGVLV
ncbi:MAG: RsmD family RNA methyltransferase, partial [Alistipes sp.]|nr:RsmD family RNA methyltransferase [Candidatus Minthomonas equi]